MRRIFVDAALMGGGLVLRAGCGIADSHSPVPEFMRVKVSEPPPPEPPPDVRELVHERLDSVFVSTSNPRQVRVSSPRHEIHGSGWTACVKAELTSAMGRPLGAQTYHIPFCSGVTIYRLRTDTADTS